MNLDYLKAAESAFLKSYPAGFEDDKLADIRKRHNMDKLLQLAADQLNKQALAIPSLAIEHIIKIVTRSSMVSLFEKPKFRDSMNALSEADRELYVYGLQAFLHGNQAQQEIGFNDMLSVLKGQKLAKWSLMTILGAYYQPDIEVYVKPTTTKQIIQLLELKNLHYKPQPSWQFYTEYKNQINAMKQHVHPSLAPSNPAFTGFLMMSFNLLIEIS